MKLKIAFICVGLCLFVTGASAQPAGGCRAGTNPTGLAFDSNNNLWVANYGSNSVTRFTGGAPNSNGTCLPTNFNVGVNPIWLAFDPVNQSMWVSNYGSNSVTELSVTTGAVKGTYFVGSGPRVLVWDGTSIWVANSLSNNVTRLDATNTAQHGKLLGTFSSGGTAPYFVAHDGKNIWVANEGSNTVTQLSDQQPTVGTLLSTTSVPSQPVDLAWDGQNIWATCYSARAVVKIQASTASVVGTFTNDVPEGPSAIVYAFNEIWVAGYAASYSSGQVLRMDAATGTPLELLQFPIDPLNPYGMALTGSFSPVVQLASFTSNFVVKIEP